MEPVIERKEGCRMPDFRPTAGLRVESRLIPPKQKGLLHLFVQRTEQVDAEGKAQQPPTSVEVLEWKPATKQK